MTTVGQLRGAVDQELSTIGNYDWRDTDTNLRLADEVRQYVDGMQLDEPTIPTAKHIAEVAVACRDYFNFRDFLMGLRVEKASPNVATYLTLVKETLAPEYAVPFIAVLSTYLFEFEQVEEAKTQIQTVLDIDPEYSLAHLLQRVYVSWPPFMMVQMAEDLHSSVVAKLSEKETE